METRSFERRSLGFKAEGRCALFLIGIYDHQIRAAILLWSNVKDENSIIELLITYKDLLELFRRQRFEALPRKKYQCAIQVQT